MMKPPHQANQSNMRILLFGTFDGLHKGHENLLKQAKNLGSQIIICLAQDHIVQQLKSKKPKYSFEKRKNALKKHPLVDEVINGDTDLGAYTCVKNAKPDLIAFGYDQTELKESLEKWLLENRQEIPTITLKPFQPTIYKSSILRKSYD